MKLTRKIDGCRVTLQYVDIDEDGTTRIEYVGMTITGTYQHRPHSPLFDLLDESGQRHTWLREGWRVVSVH